MTTEKRARLTEELKHANNRAVVLAKTLTRRLTRFRNVLEGKGEPVTDAEFRKIAQEWFDAHTAVYQAQQTVTNAKRRLEQAVREDLTAKGRKK